MTLIEKVILWPGDALARAIGLTDDGHLFRLFINLGVWGKLGAMIAVYAVEWGV